MLINWIEKLSSSELNLNLEKCFRRERLLAEAALEAF